MTDFKLRQLHTCTAFHSSPPTLARKHRHIQHTCEDTQKSGIRYDSQQNAWSNICGSLFDRRLAKIKKIKIKKALMMVCQSREQRTNFKILFGIFWVFLFFFFNQREFSTGEYVNAHRINKSLVARAEGYHRWGECDSTSGAWAH